MRFFKALLAAHLMFSIAVSGARAGEPRDPLPHAVFAELALDDVEIEDNFWSPRQETLRSVTLRTQWGQLEAYHHLDNFRVISGEKKGVHLGFVFLDSDLYKWVEAASYVSGRHPDDKWLSERLSEVVGLIGAAQMDDGYINTYYQDFAPDRRWTNLWMNHELYCAGHLIEAACAHYLATGDRSLLGPAIKFADLINAEFGPGKNPGVPGHEEIELALIGLFRVTGNRDYLDLASFFIHQRGRTDFYRGELIRDLQDAAALAKTVSRKRQPYLNAIEGESSASYGFDMINPLVIPRAYSIFYTGKYFQVHKPIEDQDVGEGHAVRAMYFYAGAGDLYLETGGDEMGSVLADAWDNTISRRTYITGGMGTLPIVEGFGRDYELPHKSYTETCAAIGSFLYSWRMLKITGEAKYADWMERTLYNAILSGISLDMKHYFYQNPLTSKGHNQRQPWYLCACCPPNLARLFASLERYFYGVSKDGIWVHQYVGGRARFKMPEGEVGLEVESGLPFEGVVKVKVSLRRPMRFVLKLRQPEWISHLNVAVNGDSLECEPEPGTYLEIAREWEDGDLVELDLAMETRLVKSPPEVKANRGRATIVRGPLVYCLEDTDNPGLDVHKLAVNKHSSLTHEYDPGLLGGTVKVEGRTTGGRVFTAIPYYAWANRGSSNMQVWIKDKRPLKDYGGDAVKLLPSR